MDFALLCIAGNRKALQHHWLDNESVSIVDNSSLILPFTRDRDSLMQAVTRLQGVNLSPAMRVRELRLPRTAYCR